MLFETTPIEGLRVITPKVFKDTRGYFFESFNQSLFFNNGIDANFVQDNQSMSQKNVIRGLHFQKPPFEQGKLVRVLKGAVLDVAVDIRKKSPTYGQYYCIELTEDNNKMFWIPPGFAHGFATLCDDTVFFYKCTGFYNKESEGGIIWNDNSLKINWQVNNPVISEKDRVLPDFSTFISPF